MIQTSSLLVFINKVLLLIEHRLYSLQIVCCYFCSTKSELSSWDRYVCVLVAPSCSTLCDPMDCTLPGSSVHGILQARILKWVAMPSSRGSSWPRSDPHLLCLMHWRWILYLRVAREDQKTAYSTQNSKRRLSPNLSSNASTYNRHFLIDIMQRCHS